MQLNIPAQGIPHHEQCRNRIEKAMREEGDTRFEAAEDRILREIDQQAAPGRSADDHLEEVPVRGDQRPAPSPGTPLPAGARFYDGDGSSRPAEEEEEGGGAGI